MKYRIMCTRTTFGKIYEPQFRPEGRHWQSYNVYWAGDFFVRHFRTLRGAKKYIERQQYPKIVWEEKN